MTGSTVPSTLYYYTLWRGITRLLESLLRAIPVLRREFVSDVKQYGSPPFVLRLCVQLSSFEPNNLYAEQYSIQVVRIRRKQCQKNPSKITP